MIISKLLGGLGNQMFQYATAKIIAVKHNTVLKYDLRGLFAGEDVRKTYELDIFGIPEVQANRKEYFPFYRESIFGSKTLWNFLKKSRKIVMYKEPDFIYNPGLIINSTPNMLLRGLFQSEKYFAHKRDLILKEFTFKKPLEGKNLELVRKFRNKNSVAVHIRRGEFAANKDINQKIGTTSMEYYNKAIDFINQKVENPVFYIFSDSPDWVKGNFELLKDATVINWNTGKESYRDMQLMSLCKHNIIANSTFSWWGAWLNQNPEKIVIAPKQWFSGWDYDTKDLIPENWIRL
jgi:hypothetical protein